MSVTAAAMIAKEIVGAASGAVAAKANALMSSLANVVPEESAQSFFAHLQANKASLLYEIGKDSASSVFGHSNAGAGTAGAVGAAAAAAGLDPYYRYMARRAAFLTFGNAAKAAQEQAKAEKAGKPLASVSDMAAGAAEGVMANPALLIGLVLLGFFVLTSSRR